MHSYTKEKEKVKPFLFICVRRDVLSLAACIFVIEGSIAS
jgi:hypothetical protein